MYTFLNQKYSDSCRKSFKMIYSNHLSGLFGSNYSITGPFIVPSDTRHYQIPSHIIREYCGFTYFGRRFNCRSSRHFTLAGDYFLKRLFGKYIYFSGTFIRLFMRYVSNSRIQISHSKIKFPPEPRLYLYVQ